MKTKKIFNILVVIGFCLVIFLVPVLTKLSKNSEYSIFENRNLAEAPVLHFSLDNDYDKTAWDKILGGYMSSWDVYFSDHIFQRYKILKIKNLIDVNLLKRPIVNDVIIQKELLLPFNSYSLTLNEQFEINAEWESYVMAVLLSDVKQLAESYGGKFIYIGVPEQCSMFREFYPEYLNNNGERLSYIESNFFHYLNAKEVEYINMRDEFNKTGDYTKYYFNTDHHYNFSGAFLTYQTLMNKINGKFENPDDKLPVLTENDIEFVRLENPFYGSRNRKLYNRYDSNDKLYYYTEKNPLPFTREDGGGESFPFVFDLPAQNDETSPVTYNIYMGGDKGETVIRTEREHLPNALIFGDSFTNPFETFLYHSFNETRSIDMRHYYESTILEYIEKHKPDYVFCMRDDTMYLSFIGNGDIHGDNRKN